MTELAACKTLGMQVKSTEFKCGTRSPRSHWLLHVGDINSNALLSARAELVAKPLGLQAGVCWERALSERLATLSPR